MRSNDKWASVNGETDINHLIANIIINAELGRDENIFFQNALI